MSDVAQAESYFDEQKSSAPLLHGLGVKDIAVGFTELSETYSMPGWRMGFAAGNGRRMRAMTRMKSYWDHGAFLRSGRMFPRRSCVRLPKGAHKPLVAIGVRGGVVRSAPPSSCLSRMAVEMARIQIFALSEPFDLLHKSRVSH